MGTAETCLERDEGCEDPCETRTTCLADLAEGCCGTRIEAATCDGTCPEGTRPDTECVSFPPECGCSMPAFVPIVQCREDLGDNHCGAIVGTPEIEGCGCPEGTLAEADCNTFE